MFVINGRIIYSYCNQNITNITECLEAIVDYSRYFNLNSADEYISNFCQEILSFAREALKTKNYYGYGNGIISNIIDRLPYIEIAIYLKKYTFLCDDKKKANVIIAYDNLIAATDLDLYLVN